MSVLTMSPAGHGGRRRRLGGLIATVAVATVAVGGAALHPNIPIPGTGGGFNGTCLVSNYTEWSDAGTDCDVGTDIVRLNSAFSCDQAATAYGPVPVRVTVTWTTISSAAGSFTADNGCTGDGNNDTLDYIFRCIGCNGAFGGTGVVNDSFKTRPTSAGPTNLSITGNFDCGDASGTAAHQDTIQWQHNGDRNITVVNAKSGNWDAGTSTCEGAGGIIYTSGGGTHIIGGHYVLCNHAMNATQSSLGENNTSVGASYRGGRIEATASGGDPACQDVSAGTGGCTNTANLDVFENNVCENWNASTNQWVTDPSP